MWSRLALALFVAGAVIAAALGIVLSSSGGEREVRLQARSLEDGRTEIALQLREGEAWGDRLLPSYRFLATDVEVGRWLSSDALTIAGPDQPIPQLYCLVTHEGPGDEEFWGLVNFGARQWDALHESIRVEVHSGSDAAAQSERIDQCVDSGALAIGVTLPDPAGVEAAIARAVAAGVYVNSFNSGLQDYGDIGSIRHVSVNEFAAGQRAGELFNEADASGIALCIIHELANTGLEERCDGLEDAYDGGVRRINVGSSGLADRDATSAAISEALTDDLGVVLALNSRISVLALEQIRAQAADLMIGTFDQNNDVLDALINGDIAFALDTSPFAQAWYTLSTMLNNQPAFRVIVEQIGVANPQDILQTFDIQLSPRLITGENAAAFLQVNRFTASQRASE